MLVVFAVVTFIFVRAITVVLHEMGHALVAAFLDNKEVTVFIGSYGSKKHCFNLKLGRMSFWFKRVPILWQVGMVVHKYRGYYGNLAISLAGPVTSTLIALLFALPIFKIATNEGVKFVSIVFIISSLIDLAVNLFPSTTAVVFDDGSIGYNDGRNILNQLTNKQTYLDSLEAYNYAMGDEPIKAAHKYEAIVKRGKVGVEYYSACFACYYHGKDYGKAKEIEALMREKGICKAADYNRFGALKFNEKDYEGCLIDTTDAIHYNPKLTEAYHNRSLALSSLGRYNEALVDASKVIELTPDSYEAYNNRASVFCNKKLYVEAIADATASIKLNSNNLTAHYYRGYAYLEMELIDSAIADAQEAVRNGLLDPYGYYLLGRCYAVTGDGVSAKFNFIKAKELGLDTPELDEALVNLSDVKYNFG